ncbi:MAG TPA: CDP-alcohol phosphatidyltransferase family protein [Pyrinomonadaceae bacterium]|nr:CDP-alcohol phosphatidyltransferase family protein [Pyrinomonadaceae bacterium]
MCVFSCFLTMNQSYNISSKIFAWFTHFFTASGLLAGFMAILAVSGKNWRAAMAWLLVALAIDGFDGTLARKFKVKEVLPNFDGKTIDYVIDFANYAIIPAYFFYQSDLVSENWSLPLSFLILMVSAIYYGNDGMVSDDFYFVGFPVMWNVVVFYLIFVFSLNELGNAAVIVFFAILHFVPIKFVYPSRATQLKFATLTVTAIFLIILPLIVWFYPTTPSWLKWMANACLAYYGVLAIMDTFRKNPKTIAKS